MSTTFNGFASKILGYLITFLSLTIAASTAIRVVVVDNTSPQVVYSPTPCYEDAPTACSIEWVLVELSQAFNGSVTSTNGPLPDPSNISVSILPRVTLSFNGSGISFIPGPNSTANASITLDNRPSIIINTSKQNYQVTQLGGNNSHTLVIDYLEGDSTQSEPDVLEVDYFLIDTEEVVSTSTSSSSISSTPLSVSTSTSPTSSASHLSQTSQPTADSLVIVGSKDRPSTGTIIAIAISASALFLAALLTWIWGAKRRRRQMAIKRENDILTSMKMPSEGDDIGGIWPGGTILSKGRSKQPSKSWWTT